MGRRVTRLAFTRFSHFSISYQNSEKYAWETRKILGRITPQLIL